MPDNYIVQPQQQDSFKTLGSVLSVAGSAQELARRKLELEKATRTLEADVSQRQSESAKAGTEARVAAETADPKIAEAAARSRTALTEADKAAQSLTQDQRGIVGGVVGVLGRAGVTDPAVYKKELENLKTVNPGNKSLHALIDNYGTIIDGLPKGAELPKIAIGASQYLLTPPQAQTVFAPQAGLTDMGGSMHQTTTTPSVMGAPPTVQISPTGTSRTLPIESRQTVGTNAVTLSPTVTEKDATGNVVNVRPAPTQGSVPQLAPGQPQDIPIVTQLRADINGRAAKVPEHHFNNEQIIKLADETNTGKAADILKNLKGGYAALPWTADTASNYDRLGHFIALEAQNNATAMGMNTDAARNISGQATASTGWTKDAIKSAVKINDALATGLDFFNRGMEKAIEAAGGNVLAVRPYQNAWAQNFDPNVYRYANALERGDKAEITKILGPEGSQARSAKAAELAQKSAVLYRLSNTGR